MKKTIKKKLFWGLLLAELVAIVIFYTSGNNGIVATMLLTKETQKIKNEIQLLEQEIVQLQDRLTAWHTCPFYKEKVAREQLQMARHDDEVYYIINKKE